jgi:phytoene dehydrogenase-like protein
MPDYDVVVIGAGNHGLTVAGYLGKEMGLKCLIVEKRNMVGGAGITVDVNGFKFHPAATGFVNWLRPEVVRDLELTKYGVELIRVDPWLTSIFPDGKYITFWENMDATCREIEKFSKCDAEAYKGFMEKWGIFKELMDPAQMAPPPSFAEMTGGMSASPEMTELMRDMFFATVKRTLDSTFENDYVKFALLPFTEGACNGPAACSLFVLVGHMCITPQWSACKGGIGNVTKAMAKAAEHYGAAIKLNTAVTKILVNDGKAVGVKLSTGDEVTCNIVISNAEVGQTMLDMVGVEHLEADFVRKVQKMWYDPTGVTLNLALSELPEFKFPKDRLKGLFGMIPSYDYAEKAFYQYNVGEIPEKPCLIGYIPSYIDPTMAPPGKHVLTVFCWPMPYELRKGSWETRKDEMLDRMVDTLTEYAPNIKRSVINRGGYSPGDLNKELGMTRADIQHGSIEWGQLLGFRPIIGWSNYRTPIPNIYLCGACTHPSGGMTGANGHNAAQIIIEDLKKAKKGKKGK